VSGGSLAGLPPVLGDGAKGTYVLVVRLGRRRWIEVGRLGRQAFDPGHYLYVGSAFGPGGLAARLRHHVRPAPRPHWHIDHLMKAARIEEIWWAGQEARRECGWAALLAGLRGVRLAFPRFGASDCRCPGHLYCSEVRPSRESFARLVEARFPEDGAVQVVG
jgi:Uri superfamily endonuclease